MELVSVIVPCYNQGAYLDECLNSIANQTYPHIEVVVVNDGSTDSQTVQILAEMKRKYPKFKFIDIPNSGVSKARNIAVESSIGEYILPLDGDDKISPTYIQRCIETFCSNEVDIVYCVGEFFGAKKGIWYLDSYSPEKIIQSNMVFVSAMFKRKDFYECAGYNENMVEGLEDWDFWLSMTERNKIFYRMNEVHFYYRIKENSRNTNMNDIEKRKKTLNQLQLNHPELYKDYSLPVEVKQSIFKRVVNRIVYEIKRYKLKKALTER